MDWYDKLNDDRISQLKTISISLKNVKEMDGWDDIYDIIDDIPTNDLQVLIAGEWTTVCNRYDYRPISVVRLRPDWEMPSDVIIINPELMDGRWQLKASEIVWCNYSDDIQYVHMEYHTLLPHWIKTIWQLSNRYSNNVIEWEEYPGGMTNTYLDRNIDKYDVIVPVECHFRRKI